VLGFGYRVLGATCRGSVRSSPFTSTRALNFGDRAAVMDAHVVLARPCAVRRLERHEHRELVPVVRGRRVADLSAAVSWQSPRRFVFRSLPTR